MAAKARMLDPVADLHRRLHAARSRTFGSAARALVHRWWNDHGLSEHPAAVGKRIALALLEQPPVERPARSRRRRPAGSEKVDHVAGQLAGILVFEELLADHLRASDLPAFAQLLSGNCLTDLTAVDAFGVKVLGTLLHRVRGRADVAQALARWRAAESPWQRRAACAAFTALAPQGDAALANLTSLVFTLCAAVVWSPAHIDQTAVGWLLCELSRAEPTRVEGFIRRHARFMSRDCAREAVNRLPAARQQELLAHWKRVTSLRIR